MKTRRAFLVVSITALVIAIILIWIRAYYVTIALIVGALLLGHRELWSLIRRRKLPPIDERVQGNISKSIRNGFIFLIIALIFLMLPFSIRLTEAPGTIYILSGLFLAAGATYLFSYLFYDRVKPKVDAGKLKMLRIFLLVTGMSLGVFIISVFLHNVIYGLGEVWFGEGFWERVGIGDEPVFFFIALLSVAGLAVGLVGSLVMFVKGLFGKVS